MIQWNEWRRVKTVNFDTLSNELEDSWAGLVVVDEF